MPERDNPALEATFLSSAQVAMAAPKEATDPLIGTRLRHFQVVRLLGRGGMGSVYLGHDTSLDRPVALKILSSDIGRVAELVARFEREARAQARLRHPSVAQIYFIGEDRGLHFFAMEYVEGPPLDVVLSHGERLPWTDALEYAVAAARGLRAALAQGFIHRDIKPSNLLLDKESHLKLVDFGLAKSLRDDVELTREGVIVGSPRYMAPEQGRAENVDHRADIYSLGCALYHMLTGRPPFSAPTPIGIITMHVTERATPIRTLAPDVPEAMERIVERMMAKDPAHRYDSYDELISAMQAARPGAQSHWSFFSRAAALGIDLGVLGLAAMALGPWAILIAIAYFVLPQRFFGQTLGKLLMRLQVTDVKGAPLDWKAATLRFVVFAWGPIVWSILGAIIYFVYRDERFVIQGFHFTANQLIVPTIFLLIFGVTFLGYLGGFLLAVFHPKKRALHDLLARTDVRPKTKRLPPGVARAVDKSVYHNSAATSYGNTRS